MTNTVLEKFHRGEPSLGTFTQMLSPIAAEILGYTGLDFVLIDMEHAPLSAQSAGELIAAARGSGITPLVRAREISRSAVLQPLDAGAMGLVVPCVETVEQVRQLVQWTKFAPTGNRGYCMTRDDGWGFAPGAAPTLETYMDESNRKTLLLPQCETAGCLARIEEIAAMEGVDGIFLGPFDLSIALGCPGQFDTPVMREATERVVNACRKNGKLAMVFSGSPEATRSYWKQGFHSAAMGLDTLVYIQAYRDLVSRTKSEA